MKPTSPVIDGYDAKRLLRISQRTFFATLMMQTGLMVLFFVVGVSTYTFLKNRNARQEIHEAYSLARTSISEAMYIFEVTNQKGYAELRPIQQFESSLRAKGLDVTISVSRCHGPDIFGVQYRPIVGVRELDHCMIIDRNSNIFTATVWGLIGIFVLSVGVSVLIWFITRQRLSRNVLEPLVVAIETRAKEQSLSELARQVAHDIRSPVAALDMLLAGSDDLSPEVREPMRAITKRIREIANNLLARGSSTQAISKPNSRPLVLTSILESVLHEKQLEYSKRPNVEIEFVPQPGTEDIFVQANASEFKTVISNLVNNAAEASPLDGKIKVVLSKTDGKAIIQIKDNGCGIPARLISKIRESGFSYAKRGNGLGLAHASDLVEAWGGELQIESEEGRGTTVQVVLPTTATPAWFVQALNLSPDSILAIVDDDETIHLTWLRKLEQAGFQGQCIHFYRSDELQRWHQHYGRYSRNTMYLIDHQLETDGTEGLELIRMLGIEDRSYLVTSYGESDALVDQCASSHIRLISKTRVGQLPVHVNG